MSTPVKNRSRAASPSEAGRLLAAGGLVVTPTETVFGIAGDASRPGVVERVWSLMSGPTGSGKARPALAWHAAAASRVRG
ncbi:MAG: hypothetical protein LDL56_09595, partial [Armatimonadetes bacterium]|nr:hypothetical protein [Armatimonadota bacterium]